LTGEASGAAYRGRTQDEVAHFFRLHLQIHGPNWRGLGWQSRHNQERRFAVLLEVGPVSGTRVLDVGCGVGDLYGYMLRKGIRAQYTGVDILPEMVAHARERYPDAQFEVGDALQGLGPERFDYVLCSGAFNVNFGSNQTAVQKILPELLACSTRGVAINFLSTRARERDTILYNYDPEAMLAFCRTLTPHVRLVEGYLSNDFTLYLYPRGNQNQPPPTSEQKGNPS
jgi:SAM-dependent methyltransferase